MESALDNRRAKPAQQWKPAIYSIDRRYTSWVAEYKKTNRQKNQCWTATRALQAAFPELRLVRGWALYRLDLAWQKDYECWSEHWWCETADGSVVDPTNEQWVDERGGEVYAYEEYNTALHGPEPIGKCLDCGSLIFEGDHGDSTSFCSESCEISTRKYYGI